MRPPSIVLAVIVCLIAAFSTAAVCADYVFGWPFQDATTLEPRGGTNQGPDVTLATEPSDAWRALQQSGPSQRERDRRASSQWPVTIGRRSTSSKPWSFPRPPRPARPTGRGAPNASTSRRQRRHHHVAAHHRDVRRERWCRRRSVRAEALARGLALRTGLSIGISRQATVGTSPLVARGAQRAGPGRLSGGRRAAVFECRPVGTYDGGVDLDGSSTWRPLPRREFTVRSDYDVLVGVNRATVLPSGWVHEQDNLKLVLDEHAKPRADAPYIARELGIDRYERIKGFDFSAGDVYWQKTGEFWRVVRTAGRRPSAPMRRSAFRTHAMESPLSRSRLTTPSSCRQERPPRMKTTNALLTRYRSARCKTDRESDQLDLLLNRTSRRRARVHAGGQRLQSEFLRRYLFRSAPLFVCSKETFRRLCGAAVQALPHNRVACSQCASAPTSAMTPTRTHNPAGAIDQKNSAAVERACADGCRDRSLRCVICNLLIRGFGHSCYNANDFSL